MGKKYYNVTCKFCGGVPLMVKAGKKGITRCCTCGRRQNEREVKKE